MDQAYADKLDGKIPEDFWKRKMSDWRAEERQIEIALNTPIDSYSDRVLSARRILELANKAYFLYVTQKPAEQAKVLANGAFELLCGLSKPLPNLQKAVRCYLRKGKN